MDWSIAKWSCIKPGIFLNYPEWRYRFFPLIVFAAGQFPADKSENYPALVESQRTTSVMCCFHLLSSPFMLHSFSVMFLSFCIHSLSCSGQVGTCPNAHVFVIFCYRFCMFLLSFIYRFGSLCRLPSQDSWTYTYILLSSFSSYRFLGRQRIGRVQAKLKCNARGNYIIPSQFLWE